MKKLDTVGQTILDMGARDGYRLADGQNEFQIMKTRWTILILLSVVFSSSAVTQPLLNSGSLTIKLMATSQALDNATVDKTNSTATSTTVTMVSRSTVSNSFLQSADILALLENSFNTTLPSGARLVVNRTGNFLNLEVTDSTGTNTVINLSSNLFLGIIGDEQRVHVGSQTIITKSGPPPSFSGNSTDAVTDTMVLGYNDTGLATKDGTHTKFEITCLVARKSSENLVNQQIKDTIKIQGIGNGIIRDQNVILQGSGSANITGVLFVPPS